MNQHTPPPTPPSAPSTGARTAPPGCLSPSRAAGAPKRTRANGEPGGARATGAPHDTRATNAPEGPGGRYSRLFPDLPPLAPPPQALIALGRAGGRCDGGTALREAGTAAGWPFFGQFVAHDITADRSPLERTDHGDLANQRLPRLNLECIYGAGPGGAPYMFDADDPAKFLLAPGGHDVPRTRQGTAIIADPRNDSHLFMAALHRAFLKAHNAFVDLAREAGLPEPDLFDAARKALTWHYQWVVAEEFLPGLVGRDLLADFATGTASIPLPEGLTLPLEFADAAYRYGHSQIRQSYRLTEGGPERAIFPDLLGFRPVGPEMAVDWRLMFDGAPDVAAQRANRISERLPFALVELPQAVTGAVAEPGYRSLANRDMQRGVLTDLPSGEAVARALGLEPLGREAIALPGWAGETPLWYYIAREADTAGEGDRLGPVGGRIVAGTLLALIERDPAGYRSLAPRWRPEIATVSGDPARFTLLDLLLFGEPQPGRA